MKKRMKARRKIIYFNPSIVIELLEKKMLGNRPSDLKIIYGFYDGQKKKFGVVAEHPTWDEKEDNENLPMIEVSTIWDLK